MGLLLLIAVGIGACSGVAPRSSWPNMSVAADTLYLASGETIYAIDPSNGTRRWSFPDEARGDSRFEEAAEFYATPAVTEGMVVVGSYNQVAFALDRDGSFVWLFDGQPVRRNTAPTSVTASPDAVYVTAGRQLHALDPSGGTEWSFTADGALWAAPAFDDQRVYQPSMDHHLYALDRASGQVAWSRKLDGALAGTPSMANGTLFLGSLSNHVYAIEAATGAVRWTFETDGWVWSSPIVDDNSGIAYFGDLNGVVYAVDANTRQVSWQVTLDSAVRGAPALAGDTLFVNTERGFVYALQGSDGAERWRQEVDSQNNADRLLATPVVSGELVAVAPLNGESLVYAFSQQTGEPLWQFDPGA